jgi:hypothetical protein
MLNQTACIGFFPNRKSRTRSAPSLDDLAIRPSFGADPFEEIENQSINWI